MHNKTVVLATQSASRVALVKSYNLDWKCVKNKFDENNFKKNKSLQINIENLKKFCSTLATEKALSVKNDFENSIIIGCDTVVFCYGKLLEKPRDLDEAKEMLNFLQNKIQYVITGVAIVDTQTKKIISFADITKLKFCDFTKEQMDYLLNDTNPLENAGGYEICDKLMPNIKIIRGTYDNIVGIPIKKILHNLENF